MKIELYSGAKKYLSECGNKCDECEFRLSGSLSHPGTFVLYVEDNDVTKHTFQIISQCAPRQIVNAYRIGGKK